ncbi:MAG TPA: lipopolysaccharide biosynthesis protein [Solirubrobacteraceae bacterium]
MSTQTRPHVEDEALRSQDPGEPAPDAPRGESAGRAVIWNGLQTWGQNLISLGVFLVLARLLSPADFGLSASAFVIIYFFRALVDAGFGRLLVQKKVLAPADADTAFWSALAFSAILILVCCVTAPLFALLYGQPRLTGIIQVLSLIFLFVALDSTQSALLQRHMQWRVQAIRRLAAAIGSAVVAIVLAYNGAGVWALVAQQLTLEGLIAILIWPMTSWRPHRRFSRESFWELVHFGARYSGLRVLWTLGGSVDNLLVGVFLGPVALGYYVIAYRVFSVLNDLITTTLNNVALPVFSRLQDDHPALNRSFLSSCRAASGIAFPLFAGMAAVAGPAVAVLFGSKWAPSTHVLEALALAGVLQAQMALIASYVIAIGQVGNELRWTSTILVFQVIGFLIAVQISLVAVALTVGIVYLLVLPLRLRYVSIKGGLRIRDYVAQLPRILIATGLMVAAVLGAEQVAASLSAGAELALEVIAGAAVYILALALLAPDLLRGLVAHVRQA